MNHDVIIVGAGLSGIGAAFHLQRDCPDKDFIILEGRSDIGGTWDLFRYPGIRSDSDMFTLGYVFKPWIADEAIADGPAILKYIKDTASENGIEEKIQFEHKVIRSRWSSKTNSWTIHAQTPDGQKEYTCNFLLMCSGYYNYDEGYTPEFKGMDDYSGTIIHPQKWPENLDYTGQKVVVIGSGATAITLVPEMAKKASEVIMLQRSPTYIMTAPEKDAIANGLRKVLPPKWAYGLSRWKNILFTMLFYNVCKKWPITLKNLLLKGVKKQVGAENYSDKDFSPKYNPWDQRLCVVPDGDLFESLKSGKSKIVTDQIKRFTKNGLQLESGDALDADIIVTATGLNLQFLGGMDVEVDGRSISSSDLYCYRGMMFTGVPNLIAVFGYTNASWTLKCDLSCAYTCRLLNHMTKSGKKKVYPLLEDDSVKNEPFLDLSSNYILRSSDILPKQGSKRPWRLYQNYILDIFNFKYSSFKDRSLKFD